MPFLELLERPSIFQGYDEVNDEGCASLLLLLLIADVIRPVLLKTEAASAEWTAAAVAVHVQCGVLVAQRRLHLGMHD
jgi:hypothetical protein